MEAGHRFFLLKSFNHLVNLREQIDLALVEFISAYDFVREAEKDLDELRQLFIKFREVYGEHFQG